MLEKRINDRAFIRLIAKWLKAGILEPDGYVKHPVAGTPQTGIVSPILSNLYLHIVLDEWFQDVVKIRLKGRAIMCSYADDWYAPFNTGMMQDGSTMFFPKGLVVMSCKWSRARRRSYDSVDFIPVGNVAGPSRFLGLNFIGSKTAKVSYVQSAKRRHPNSRLRYAEKRRGSKRPGTYLMSVHKW